MADTIVKSFVIDTSKAEQSLRSLDAVGIATKSSLDALYNELIRLDEQLAKLDPNSQAFADVNTQILALENTISNIETGNIEKIGVSIQSIDTAKIEDVGSAIDKIDTADAARNIEQVGNAVEDVVTPVNQLANATGELNTELKDTKVDTSNLDTASSEYKDLAGTQEEVVTSSKSLKAQLRELQAQLAATDPDSAKYRELAAAAGELKDRIQDAAQAVGTQAGGAFERVGGSLGLVTSRIASLDFEGAAEGAKQLAVNIGQVKPGDITKGIQSIGNAFGAVGKALLTNPIFLIGAAIAAAIVYADELLSLIDGVTDAEQEALDLQKERAALAKEQVDAIGQQEESLKRQGLSEKQITDLKLKALDAAILEQEVVIETSKAQAKAQIEAAQRNADYLKGFLDFVSIPQKLIYTTFQNFVNGAIGILRKLGVEVEEIDILTPFENLKDFAVKQIFDPEQTKKEGEATIKEAEKTLVSLRNQRDGILNQEDAKNKARAEKRAADAKAEADKKLKAEQELAAQEEELFQEILKNFEDAEKAKTDAALKEQQKRLAAADQYYNELAQLQDAEYVAGLTAQEKEELAISQKYEKLIALAEAAGLDTTEITKKWQDELANVAKQGADNTAATSEATKQKEIADAQAVQDAKLALASQSLGTIANLATAFAKGDEARAKKAFKLQKAASIAQATVDTYKGAQGIFANAAINPSTILFPAQPYIQAALAVAAGLVNVKNIASQQFQSNTPPSTPPPSTGGGGGGGVESQPAQFNPLASQFIQDRPDQLTPRAFVLAGDVASQQEVRQKVEDLARLG